MKNINFYNLHVKLPNGEMMKVKPSNLEDLKLNKWWELEEWYFYFKDTLILTPAGEVADLHYDIEDLRLQVLELKGSKKRQHMVAARHLKQTILFLNWVFTYCERNEIGTTAFYALLMTDNIDEE